MSIGEQQRNYHERENALPEQVHVLNRSWGILGTQERKKYYAWIEKWYEELYQNFLEKKITEKELQQQTIEWLTTQIETFRAFLLNTKGDLLLYLRDDEKDFNGGQFDKVGGHIGLSTLDTVIKQEIRQEIDLTPELVSRSEFKGLIANNEVTKKDLERTAFLRPEEYINNFISWRRRNKDNLLIPCLQKTTILFWYTNASLPLGSDGENQGVILRSKEKLQARMEKYPDLFTWDMHELGNRYYDKFVSLDKFMDDSDKSFTNFTLPIGENDPFNKKA